MLEEIGIPYQREPVRPYTESQSAEYLRINPNGHIPSLDDDGVARDQSVSRRDIGRPGRKIMGSSINGA
jgi:glutathione S-transferase